jgi:hypothetical protein
MPHWTNHELRRMDDAHRKHRPTGKELKEMFPRHSLRSISSTAYHRGLRKRNFCLEWLTIAHLHFSRREAEMRQAA